VRLLHAEQLRTQEAVLTGESAPVDKRPGAAPPQAPLAERHSMLHAGTVVAAGTGLGVAVATGSETQVGRISALVDAVDPLQTPLTRELDRLGTTVTAVIGVAAVMLGVVAAVRGFPAGDAALAGISLAVAAVPEGLPAVVTIALAIGVRRMARRRAIIRHLPAVETLGSTTVVASDKTGTLTRNQMTVQAAWTPGAGDDLRELLLASVLCNDASLARSDGGHVGDPTETALLEFAAARGIDVDAARAENPRLDALPFDSERKLMATRHKVRGDGTAVYVKGAPEVVLPLCADGAASGAAAHVERLADQGQRVLVLAAGEREATSLEETLGGLRLLGLEAMIDPPREAALDAVTASREAGVRVMMITGDHPRTALAIGRALGLSGGSAITGPELEAADDDALRERVRDADVYARVAPEHKLRLVRALQSQGEVVAMTGDGVNDAPALRQADIGVAMGRGGSAAAKEAADMVLADDDFGTLRAAIEEGRRVYDNLVKALSFVLPTSLGQALIIAIAVLAFPLENGQPLLPVEPVQILWINLIVAVALALPLALEAAEPDLMRRPPRNPRAPLAGPADDRPHARGRGHADRGRPRPLRRPAQPPARRAGRPGARARPRADDGGHGSRAPTGPVSTDVPVVDAAQPRDRPLEQPVGLRRHRRGASPAGALCDRPVHARRLRLRADRRARARRVGRGRAGHPAGDLGGGALARAAASHPWKLLTSCGASPGRRLRVVGVVLVSR